MRSVLAILLASFMASKAYAQVSLPHDSSFSVEEGFVDEVALPIPWGATGSVIVTADDVAHSGSQSVRIPAATPEHVLSLSFDPSGSTVVFIDYYVQLGVSPLPTLPLLTTPETTAMLALQSGGANVGEWAFLDGDALGGGQWFRSGAELSLDALGRSGWQHITLRLDLFSSLWDVYVNEQLLAANLGFVESLQVGSEAINIYGNSSTTSYLDTFEVSAVNPLFTDHDSDGIDDMYESENGLSILADDRDLDLDGDGLSNLEEYLWGFDPQDSDDGDSDFDGDGYPAWIEMQLGTNPNLMSGSVNGKIVLRRWLGIDGRTINDLISNVAYPYSPSVSQVINQLKLPLGIADSYGSEVFGFIIPEISGDYRFWVSADDRGHFYLSSDDTVSNAIRVAYTNAYTSELQWGKYPSQKSTLINLQAGQRYYFRAIHKEDNGGDHMAVAWTKPDGTFEIIPSSVLASIPSNDVDFDRCPDHLEQLIIDAEPNDTIETLEDVVAGDDFDGDGLSNDDEWQLSTNATLVDSDGDGMEDGFETSRGAYDPLDAADGKSDYDIDGYSASIEAQVGSDPDVFDSSVPGYLVLNHWSGVLGGGESGLTTITAYPFSPDSMSVLSMLEFPSNIGDNYGNETRGYLMPDLTGDYYFLVSGNDGSGFYLSSDDRSENQVRVAGVTGWTNLLQWDKYPEQKSVAIYLEAGRKYYFRAVHKEGTGSDHMAVAWIKPDGSFEVIKAENVASYAPNDIDLDLIPDALEQIAVDADPNDAFESVWDLLPTDDFDGDGLGNIEEIELGLSLTNPDSDGDGLLDGFEQSIIDFDPNDTFVSHADVLPDADFDGDTVTNIQEQQIGSDPTDVDSDDSGRNDDFEWTVISARSDDAIHTFADVLGLAAGHDMDGDGLSDVYEYTAGLSLVLKDTDGDGIEDGWENDNGYSAATNEGLSGAFGDLEGDRLANETENGIGSSATTVDAPASILTTSTKTGGNVAIILIGRGAFTVDEGADDSSLSY